MKKMVMSVANTINTKYLRLLICVIAMITAVSLSGCDDDNSSLGIDKTTKYRVMCTTFPLYDWTRNIVGDSKDVEVVLLADNGLDMHNFEPSMVDLARISSSDMIILVGGESEKWLLNLADSETYENVICTNLFEALSEYILEEDEFLGQHNHEHIHDEDEHNEDEHNEDEHNEDEHNEDEHSEHEHGEEEVEMDEHIWLSITRTLIACETIKDALCDMDFANSKAYEKNYLQYKNELLELDEQFAKTVNNSKYKTMLVADRFPFKYMCSDYGIEYYAAFSGCSTDTNSSFSTIVKLIEYANENELSSVVKLENTRDRLAATVAKDVTSKQLKVCTLDSLQSVDKKAIDNGITYIELMKKNLNELQKILN